VVAHPLLHALSSELILQHPVRASRPNSSKSLTNLTVVPASNDASVANEMGPLRVEAAVGAADLDFVVPHTPDILQALKKDEEIFRSQYWESPVYRTVVLVVQALSTLLAFCRSVAQCGLVYVILYYFSKAHDSCWEFLLQLVGDDSNGESLRGDYSGDVLGLGAHKERLQTTINHIPLISEGSYSPLRYPNLRGVVSGICNALAGFKALEIRVKGGRRAVKVLALDSSCTPSSPKQSTGNRESGEEPSPHTVGQDTTSSTLSIQADDILDTRIIRDEGRSEHLGSSSFSRSCMLFSEVGEEIKPQEVLSIAARENEIHQQHTYLSADALHRAQSYQSAVHQHFSECQLRTLICRDTGSGLRVQPENKEVYDRLIGPFEAELASLPIGQEIVVVVHDLLAMIPLAVMVSLWSH